MKSPQWVRRVFPESFRETLSDPEVRGALAQVAVFVMTPILYLAFAPWYVNVISVGVVGFTLYYAVQQGWLAQWWVIARLPLFVASIIIMQFFVPRGIFLGFILLSGTIFYWVGWEAVDRRWRFAGGAMIVWALLSFWLTLRDSMIDGFR